MAGPGAASGGAWPVAAAAIAAVAMLVAACAPSGDEPAVRPAAPGASIAVGARAAIEGPRPDTRRMTCAEANALVQRRGAVVMTTGPHTFRRFVANRNYCDSWEITRPEFAPTSDNPQCVIQGVCVDPPFDIEAF